MNYTVKLNGTNISDKLNAVKCITTDRLGGMCDDVAMEIPYQGEVSFNEGDELELIVDECSTGIMYVDECAVSESKETVLIKAISYRNQNKRKKSRVWYDVTLNQIAEDVAKNCDLKLETYGTENYTYASVYQCQESDMGFLTRVCRREGYSVKCSGQQLIIFDDCFLENSQETYKLDAKDVTRAKLKIRTDCLSEVNVSFFDLTKKLTYSYTAVDESINGGSQKKIEVLSNQAEAERFARGYLRSVNNTRYSGFITLAFNSEISAGTVIELTGYDNFDGEYIVYEVSNDLINELTYLRIRNTLSY